MLSVEIEKVWKKIDVGHRVSGRRPCLRRKMISSLDQLTQNCTCLQLVTSSVPIYGAWFKIRCHFAHIWRKINFNWRSYNVSVSIQLPLDASQRIRKCLRIKVRTHVRSNNAHLWSPAICFTGWPQKVSHKLLSTCLPSIDWFLKFSHWRILWKICNNVVTKHTTPQLRRYTTLWNIKSVNSISIWWRYEQEFGA